MAKGDSSAPPSMLQGLQSVLGALGGMMAAPDADVQFLTTLQHAIVAKIKQGTQAANSPGAGQPPGGPPGPPSAIQPGGGAGMSGFGAVMGGAPPGGMGQSPQPGMGAPGPSGIGAPNPDELRRTLGATGQAA